jgi:hypothetical protein
MLMTVTAKAAGGATGRRWVRDLLVECLIAALAIAAYYGTDAVREGGAASAVDHSAAISAAERQLGLYWEKAFQDLVLRSRFLTDAANVVYLLAHWPAIAPAATWLFVRRRPLFRRYRTAFLVAMAVAFPIFMLYPVAPPRLAEAGFTDTERSFVLLGVLQPPQLLNSYAAFPSLHLCWNIIVAAALVEALPPGVPRLLVPLMPVAMTLAIVATANHYILDAVAGAGLAAVALAVSGALHRAGRPLAARRESRALGTRAA